MLGLGEGSSHTRTFIMGMPYYVAPRQTYIKSWCLPVIDRLALGTVQFGLPYGIANRMGQVSRDEASAILKFAWAMGLDTLDTAIAYGESEQRLGEIGVSQWQIISKLPLMPESCPDISSWVRKLVSDSLERLRVGRLYGLLLHHPQQLMGQRGQILYETINNLKQQGMVEKIGISVYDPQELEALTSSYQLDLVQAPFNVLDRRLITTGWLTKLKQAGTEVHVRSVFLQGLMLMDATSRPARFQKWRPLWNTWHEWLIENQLSPLQASLGFALANTEIDRVLVGVDTLQQLQEILSTAKIAIPSLPIELSCEDSDLINPTRWN